jgi:magnesium transporter
MIFRPGFCRRRKKLRGSLSIKKLLQESDTAQSIRYLMDSCLFRVKPDDERRRWSPS